MSALDAESLAKVRVGAATPRLVPSIPAVTDHWLNVSHWLISVAVSTTDISESGSAVVPTGRNGTLGFSVSGEPVERADLYLKGGDSSNWTTLSWSKTEEDADDQVSFVTGIIRIQPGLWGWNKAAQEWTIAIYGQGSAIVTEETEDETLTGTTSWILDHEGAEEIGEFMGFTMKAVVTESNEGLSPPPLTLEILITPATYYDDWF